MPVSEVNGETRVESNHVYVISPRRNLSRRRRGASCSRPAPKTAPTCRSTLFSIPWRRIEAVRRSASFSREPRRMARWACRPSRLPAAIHVRSRNWDGEVRQYAGKRYRRGRRGFCPLTGRNRAPFGGLRAGRPRRGRASGRNPAGGGPGSWPRYSACVQIATGVDFTYYKPSTISRRIKRRMVLRGFGTLEDYSRELERNREESAALCESCLITVTSFFREPEVFEELKKKVFPRPARKSRTR